MENRTALTYRYEKWRALSAGVLESASITFLLLVAVRWFKAGATAKALIATGGSLGLLLSPLTVSFVESRRWTTSAAAARMCLFGAGCFLVSALCPFLPVFVLCSMIGMATFSGFIPLLTQIYQENYPDNERGRRFSRTIMIRIGTDVVFCYVAGRALDGHIEKFQILLFVYAAAFAFAAFCLHRIPSQPLVHAGGSRHPVRALRFAKTDRLFRLTLISWMFMGTATLMMQPLRVEYLANSKYGQNLSITAIALLTGVLPNAIRLVLSPVWGWLFDNLNFFLLRVVLNIGFMLGIIAFFTTQTYSGLICGAIIYGISNAGGDVAWSLWVTKFAPPARVADYMSVHTFFTGLRGVVAPIISFHLVAADVPLPTLGWICAGMIVTGTLLLLPEIKVGRTARPGAALIEEISE